MTIDSIISIQQFKSNATTADEAEKGNGKMTD